MCLRFLPCCEEAWKTRKLHLQKSHCTEANTVVSKTSKDQAARHPNSHFCATASVLLHRSTGSWGNENKFALCISSSMTLWLFCILFLPVLAHTLAGRGLHISSCGRNNSFSRLRPGKIEAELLNSLFMNTDCHKSLTDKVSNFPSGSYLCKRLQ